ATEAGARLRDSLRHRPVPEPDFQHGLSCELLEWHVSLQIRIVPKEPVIVLLEGFRRPVGYTEHLGLPSAAELVPERAIACIDLTLLLAVGCHAWSLSISAPNCQR